MIPHTLKKYRYLRATFRAQKVFAKNLGYVYKDVSGNSGFHKTNTVNFFEIHIGRDQSLEDRVITFAHELGHALDIIHNPMTMDEKSGWAVQGICPELLTREASAWKYGWKLLQDMRCASYVKERFDVMEADGLLSYRKLLQKRI